jgi:hypothetical protein
LQKKIDPCASLHLLPAKVLPQEINPVTGSGEHHTEVDPGNDIHAMANEDEESIALDHPAVRNRTASAGMVFEKGMSGEVAARAGDLRRQSQGRSRLIMPGQRWRKCMRGLTIFSNFVESLSPKRMILSSTEGLIGRRRMKSGSDGFSPESDAQSD